MVVYGGGGAYLGTGGWTYKSAVVEKSPTSHSGAGIEVRAEKSPTSHSGAEKSPTSHVVPSWSSSTAAGQMFLAGARLIFLRNCV